MTDINETGILDRNLALEVVRVTEAVALSASKLDIRSIFSSISANQISNHIMSARDNMNITINIIYISHHYLLCKLVCNKL